MTMVPDLVLYIGSDIFSIHIAMEDALYTSFGVRTVETDVEIGEKMSHPELVYNRIPKIAADGWIEDIGAAEKEVYLIVWFSFLGSRRRTSFFIHDVFRHRLLLAEEVDGYAIPIRKKYLYQAITQMYKTVLNRIKKQLDENGLDLYKPVLEKQLRNYFTHNLKADCDEICEMDSQSYTVTHMSKEQAEIGFPKVFPHQINGLTEEDYKRFLDGAKEVLIYEVSAEGTAGDILDRLIYAINSNGHEKKDIFYYIEAGNTINITPDVSTITQVMNDLYNVVLDVLGVNTKEEGNYTKALAGVIVR